MRKDFVIAIRATLVTLVLTGLVYPFAVTGIAQLFFPSEANGGLVRNAKGIVVGSELIGQTFAAAPYLRGRPSAAGNGYDATASSGSNLGPTSAKLRDRVAGDIDRLRGDNPDAPLPVPTELVTSSASGLDPELSPSAALWQVPRIARARQVAPERIAAVIVSRVEGRDLGIFGEPRVNVLALNLALDQQFGEPVPAPPAVVPPIPSAAK